MVSILFGYLGTDKHHCCQRLEVNLYSHFVVASSLKMDALFCLLSEVLFEPAFSFLVLQNSTFLQ